MLRRKHYRLLKNVKCKNGCAVSSIGKVNLLLFGFIGALITMWPSMNCRSLKTAKNLRINITKDVVTNVTHCFILNGKELTVHYSTIADVFCDVFVMFICGLLRSYIFVGTMYQ